jgi:hypothetical protein
MRFVGVAFDADGARITNLGAATSGSDCLRGDQVGGTYLYGGATYDLDLTTKRYMRLTGDPAPTTNTGDTSISES